MEQLKEMLFQLCSAAGTPGDEHFAALQAKKALEPYCTDVTIDHMGNVIGFMGDKNAERQVMLDAHIDQIGMIVTQIDEDGFLHIAPCGGVDRRVLPGAPVTVYGHETLTGIVCCLPPHLVEDDGNKVEPVDKMAVDLGLTKEEAAKFFPVYFELQDKKKALNDKAWGLIRKGKDDKTTEAQYAEIMEGVYDARIASDQLERTYYEKYKKILSNKKIYMVQKAEMRFHKELLKKAKK